MSGSPCSPGCKKYFEDNPEVMKTERMSGTFPYFEGLEGLESR
jgi:manganese-dependent ADP-ribose/CDP-alcohol diphosphatase